MRKLILLGALVLTASTTASAQTAQLKPSTWFYAEFAVWTTAQEKNYFWTTPDLEGMAARASGPNLEAVNTKSNCNVKPVAPLVLNIYDLFNCFGSRGWELVSTDTENLSALVVKTYWFKRIAP